MNDAAAVSPGGRDPAAGAPFDVDALVAVFRGRTARIGVIGLGYVGLPLLRTVTISPGSAKSMRSFCACQPR
jgi:hypothetical protein